MPLSQYTAMSINTYINETQNSTQLTSTHIHTYNMVCCMNALIWVLKWGFELSSYWCHLQCYAGVSVLNASLLNVSSKLSKQHKLVSCGDPNRGQLVELIACKSSVGLWYTTARNNGPCIHTYIHTCHTYVSHSYA